ncbi:hypothetical protein I600_3038 [Maribacter dokdonensis DSW-8]|nr:hypothetical protein I600_3038 [Maribacter dokdonensis DSW-8]
MMKMILGFLALLFCALVLNGSKKSRTATVRISFFILVVVRCWLLVLTVNKSKDNV